MTDSRDQFAERFALLYAEAGDPPLKRVAEAASRVRRVDERGRPIQVTTQRLSDWRRGRNTPARFGPIAVAVSVLIGFARTHRPEPVVPGLYDLDRWHVWWSEAVAGPVNGPGSEVSSGVCPYRGLASFRQEDHRWYFGRD